MAQQKKYSIGGIIHDARERNYKTAKEFCAEHATQLKVSYPHYASIEQGKNLPDIELAISIAKILKIDLKLICHVWAKDQMPDAETQGFFEPIAGLEVQGIPTTFRQQIDEFYVFNEKHLPFLIAHPAAWGVIAAILAFSDSTPLTPKDLTKLFEISAEETEAIVEWARNEALIISEKNILKARRRFFHMPNTPEFRQVRDNNFSNLAAQIIRKIKSQELLDKDANRITFMRRMTRVQAQQIVTKIEDLVGQIGNLPDVGQEFYGFVVALGPLFKFSGDGGEA